MADLAADTRNAFDFIEKLYFETSYLIKEVEGQLQEEEPSFVILRPSGYQVTAFHSVGLETGNVRWWLRKVVSVGFVEEEATKLVKGQTISPIHDLLRVLFLTIVLHSEELREPTAFFGLIDDVTNKNTAYTKFEHLMWEFPSSWGKMFDKPPKLDYEDGYCALRGQFNKVKLYSLKSSEDVRKKLVEPMLEMYRR